MNPQNTQTPESTQPVAYDAEGRPLYYHPPQQVRTPSPVDVVEPEIPVIKSIPGSKESHVNTRPDRIEGHGFNPQIRSQYANEPQVVHATRHAEPQGFEVSDELRRKHEASVRRYPFLNLSEVEFVILDIKRHPIGMLMPIGVTLLLLLGIFAFIGLYPSMASSSLVSVMPSPTSVLIVGLLLSLIVVLGGAAALWVYLQNQFFMTNESVIQEIQESLFSRHEQTVSLGSIEDASFRQSGIVQTILNYGTIRLSTEGEETTYIFHYVTNPKKQIAVLNNAIEAFKNGRPVWAHDN